MLEQNDHPSPGATERLGERLGHATSIAFQAYVWGYPLVVMERTRRLLTSDGRSGAPLNTFRHGTRLLTHKDREVVRPNNDTLYSSAWLSVSREPLVLEVPDLADRYYSFQLMDAYTNSWAYIGRRTTGTAAGRFMIVGPDWIGDTPAGVSLMRSPTPTVWLLGRTLVDGDEDVPAVKDLIRQYRLVPLSEYLGHPEPTTPADRPIGHKLSPHDIASAGLAFFDELGAAIVLNPPPDTEIPLLDTFASAGIGPGLSPSQDASDPWTRQGLEYGMASAESLLAGGRVSGEHLANGWSYSLDVGSYGQNYLLRALVARYGLGALHPQEALYARPAQDASGSQLCGQRRYKLFFAPDQLPPVDAFWSLTAYGKDSFLIDNPIDRYSIGDRTPGLVYDRDGSLTIHIQNEEPAVGRANWLPVPTAPFELSLRCYQPRPQLLEGRYTFPSITALD